MKTALSPLVKVVGDPPLVQSTWVEFHWLSPELSVQVSVDAWARFARKSSGAVAKASAAVLRIFEERTLSLDAENEGWRILFLQLG